MLIENESVMRYLRTGKGAAGNPGGQYALKLRGLQQIITANYMGNTQPGVVYDTGEVVSRSTVTPPYHRVHTVSPAKTQRCTPGHQAKI